MTAVCRALKRDGTPCTLSVHVPNGYCWAHDPGNRERRRKAASNAGRARPNREVQALKDEVREVIGKVERGALDRNDASAMLQGYRVLKDLVELERRVKTTEELAEQLRELKRRVDGQQRAWR